MINGDTGGEAKVWASCSGLSSCACLLLIWVSKKVVRVRWLTSFQLQWALNSQLHVSLWFLPKTLWFLQGQKGTPKYPEDRSPAILIANKLPEVTHHKLAPLKLMPALMAYYTLGISCQGLKTEMFHLKREILSFYIWENLEKRAFALHYTPVSSIPVSVCTSPAGFHRHSIFNPLP